MGTVIFSGFFLAFAPPVKAAGYYSSTSGSGTACSLTAPCGLNSGISRLAPGDTLYLRQGTYNITVDIGNSGTASAPVTVDNYQNETVVIDGKFSIPGGSDWDPLVHIGGSYVILRDVEVTQSDGEGVLITGTHSQIINIYSHHNHEAGVIITGDYSVADGCRIYYNSMHNELGKQLSQGAGWGTGISAARHPSYAVIRNTVSWNNWGEGISTFGADHTTLEDNISYDNWSVNMYIQNVQYATVQRNLIYRTPNNIFTTIANKASETGLVEDNEDADAQYGISSNNTYINNFVYGNHGNFIHWSSSPPMQNGLIANNTFVNTTGNSFSNIHISGTSSNVRFVNNIIVQDDNLEIASIGGGVTKANNLWSTTPPSGASGTNDIIANPLLLRSGVIQAGQLSPRWFALSPGSPAIDHGQALSQVTVDYFKTQRPYGPSPDIGGHEYTGSVQLLSPTPTSSLPQPTATTGASKPGDANGDGKVDGLDYVIWRNNYNQAATSGPSAGDFNRSGFVDGLDYVIWRNNYNQ